MADIVLNGESLELAASYRITQVQRSGHFSNDIRQDLTEPFTLPYKDSPRNKRILRNINLPQAILATEKFSVFYEFGGTYYPAEMVLREIKDNLQVNIYFDKQALTVLSKNCDEVDWVNNSSLQVLYANARSKVWPEVEMFFPMIGAPNFYDDEDTDPADKQNKDWEGVINRHQINTGSFSINSQYSGGNGDNITSLAPQIALLEVLKRGFEIDDYTIQGDFTTNIAARRAFVFNNVVLDRGLFTIFDDVEATRSAASFSVFDASARPHFPFNQATNAAFNLATDEYLCGQEGELEINFTCNSVYVQNSFWHIRFIHPNGGESTIMFRHFFNHYGPIQLYGTTTITPQLLGSKIYIMVISPQGYNTNVNVTDAHISFKMDRVPEAVFDPPGNCGRFLPDMKFIDFVKEMMQGFNLRMDLDRKNKTVSFNFRSQVLNQQATQDLSPYLTKMEIDYEERKDYLVRYASFSSEEDEYKDFRHQNCLQVSSNGESRFLLEPPANWQGETIQLKTHPMIKLKVNNGGTIVRTSTFLGKAVSSIYETGADKMTKLRVAFFVGTGNTLPIADNKYVVDDQGLDMQIFADPLSVGSLWSNWLIWQVRDNRTYTAICNMPKVFLTRMNIEEPFHINNVKYLVDEVESIIEEEDTCRVEFRLKLI